MPKGAASSAGTSGGGAASPNAATSPCMTDRFLFDSGPTMRSVYSAVQASGGRMHLGNYLGAVQGWVALQRRPGASPANTVYAVADLHALTAR